MPFNLLFTSPPYYAVTSYSYDQWLRIWMLGGNDRPTKSSGSWLGRFENREAYHRLLATTFHRCARAMAKNAVAYVRADARSFSRATITESLERSFPDKQIRVVPQPYSKDTQTSLYGDKAEKPGEIDIILQPK